MLASMSVKLTVVYDNPKDPAAFEQHYASVHAPLVGKMSNVQRAEVAKVLPKEDGTATPAYRVAELYFADYATACDAIASPAGQAVIADAQKVGTGGVRFLLCDIEAG